MTSPPLAQEVVDDLDRLAAEKQELMARSAFDEAARLAGQERPLRLAAATLVLDWNRHRASPE